MTNKLMQHANSFERIRPGWRIAAALLALLVAFTAAIGSLNAQQITGSFTGTVEDPSGAVISGAQIELTNQTTADKRKTVSNDSGNFTFASVIPGTYTVTVQAKGFSGWKQTELVLNAGDSRAIAGIRLAVGSSADTVTVQAGDQQLVPTDNGELSATLSEHDIQRLSVESRNLSELLKVLPGVTTVANGIGNGTQFDFLTTSGASGSTIGVGLSPNGAPYRGGTAYLLDGANILDPGCSCYSIATVNPDMTSEVKIQTSNFGADSADGPVILNVISKAGTAKYHGQAYMYTRNGVLNSNYWQNNHAGTPRTEDAYYYPGGNFGGPVRLPLTDFNKNGKLLFWFGYEYQWQNPGSSTILKSDVPGADMRNGNFTLNNTTDTSSFDSNAALCPGGFTATATNWCNNLSGGFNGSGAAITNPGAIPVDPGAKALMSLFPAANVNPATNSGFNFYKAFGGQSNVYVYRVRVDYNLNESNKLFVAYQQSPASSPTPAHIYYNPSNAAPFPGGQLNNTQVSRVLTGNLLTIFTPTFTNEFVGAWGHLTSPIKPTNIKASYLSTIGYNYGTVFNGASLVAPGIYSAGAQTFPDMSQPDLWSTSGGSYPSVKATPSFTDNLTKVYKNHTIKFGLFTELVSNYQGSYETPNGTFSFSDSIQGDPYQGGTVIGTKNPTANLVMGIASGFTQNNSDPLSNLAYRTTSGFVMDDWKALPRLTLNLGLRFDHIGRWYDRTGQGMAVWLPGNYTNDVASLKSYPGVSWHGINPGIPNSGSPVRGIFTSPRVGLAYDIFGTGKTVLRGGFGDYRWNDQYNDFAGPATTAALVKTFNTPSGNVTFNDISNLGAKASALGALPSSVSVADPNDYEDAASYAYNFTVSQQLPWRSLLQVGYVGNNTTHQLMGGQSSGASTGSGYTNQNKIPLGGVFKVDPVTGAPAPTDPDQTKTYNLTDYYPYYQGYGQNAITMYSHVAYSNYNGLQAEWVKQAGNLSFNLNYTYSKALGIVPNSIDAFTVHGNYGVLAIDRPHVVTTSYAYSLGNLYKGGEKILGGATNGWTISGVTTWQAGGNLQANSSQNLGLSISDTATGTNVTTLSYYGTNVGDIQPITTCNPKSGLSGHQLVNLNCFAPPALGVVGPREYGYLGGPSYFNSDLTLFKAFHVRERQTIEFRAAAFNFLNHPLWQYTSSSIITPTFTTANKVNFASNLSNTLPSGTTQGTPDQKEGRRLGELSIKYNF